MQERVQASVLRLIDCTSTVDPAAVRQECLGADLRDVHRAVELLLQGGLIAGTLVGVTLTARGRARLGTY